MILDTPPTLDALGRRSLARTLRDARRRHSRAPSPRRDIYLRLPPPTLLGFVQGVDTGALRSVNLESKARKDRVETAYTSTGSLELVAAILATEARYLASRQAAGSLDEALARRAWVVEVVASDLALVEDAVAAGWLAYAPPAAELEPLEITVSA